MNKITKKKEIKKNNLLHSAYKLFTTVGFSKTTVLNIALNAGVGKGTFYLYFESKEEIRDILIMEKSSNLLLSALTALDTTIKTTEKEIELTVSDKVIFIIDYILNTLSEDLDLLQFISKNLTWGLFEKTKYIKEKNNNILDFYSFVSDLMEKDKIKFQNPLLMIYTIIELVNSSCYRIILYNEPVCFEEYKTYLYHVIRVIVNDSILS